MHIDDLKLNYLARLGVKPWAAHILTPEANAHHINTLRQDQLSAYMRTKIPRNKS